MRTADFDFDLPDGAIALRPARPRDSARLLVVRGAETAFEDRIARDLPSLLRPGDALVFNDTRVLPVHLRGRRGAASIRATLIERVEERCWWAFVRNARRLRPGDVVTFGAELEARVETKRADGAVLFAFRGAGALEAELAGAGSMPLPPYIAQRRAADAADAADYQTIYAAKDGSVAAPTAGLHFTPDLLARLDAAGVERVTLTLHVGPGTFLPVKADAVADHPMHGEWGEVSPEAAERLNAVRAASGRIIAVGTTSLRLIETAADANGRIRPFAGATAIFITPGHRFRAADGLMTNFHLPRSTLFMLVAALMGLDRMRAAYAHAIERGYRFYSYGDASLLLPDR